MLSGNAGGRQGEVRYLPMWARFLAFPTKPDVPVCQYLFLYGSCILLPYVYSLLRIY